VTKTSTIKTFLLCALLIAGVSSNAVAVQDGFADKTIAEELRTLSESIDNLARQLNVKAGSDDQETRLRKLDIAISYLNFRSRRIEMFERDLQSSRAGRNRLEDLLDQFSREEESLAQTFDGNPENIERAKEEMALRRQAIKTRISRMDEEIILLENRIMDMQSQIDSVESYVQKNLEF
jgi:chromosome segregation ATPase